MKEILNQILKDKTGEEILEFNGIKDGVNSIAHIILTDQNNKYLVKQYIVRKADRRDRLATEFYGLSFLWNNSIHVVPRPVCMDQEKNIGIYEFINGKKLKAEEIGLGEVKLAADFLKKLHLLGDKKDADKQPVASEACYTIKAYIDHLEGRLTRLQGVSRKNKMLHSFLEGELIPFFTKIKQFVITEATSRRLDLNHELDSCEKTLSPSDFGFHNIIKRHDGVLCFIDFEYYGWDDPAKLIADFYLQPAVPVPDICREAFFNEIIRYYAKDTNLAKRLPLVYLLLAIKWSLIMLNDFLYFSDSDEETKRRLIKQIEKAKNKLDKTREEFLGKAFPLSLN